MVIHLQTTDHVVAVEKIAAQHIGTKYSKCNSVEVIFFLFGVLRRFQHCTGHITMGSWKGRGNQYIEFARVLYCKLPTIGKQLPAFPHKALTGIEPRPQRWEARVLPLCHRVEVISHIIILGKVLLLTQM